MTDIASLLDALRRPKILVRAARSGLADYRRERDLRRLLRNCRACSVQTIRSLLEEEARLEDIRVSGKATYSIQRHVAVLTALLAESRLASVAR